MLSELTFSTMPSRLLNQTASDATVGLGGFNFPCTCVH
jgi:hypothetical protein